MQNPYPNGFKIVILGVGNVTYTLSQSLSDAGHRIVQFFGRSEESLRIISNQYGCPFTTNINELDFDADIYILAVPDSAITSLANSLPRVNGIVAHTSGSTPMDSLEAISDNYSVFYPFQTFTKGREVSLVNVPFCIEASNPDTKNALFSLAESIGGSPIEMNSEARQWLHLAGVFSCNFVNHMLAIGQILSQENEFDFKLLKPLISETINKALEIGPVASQTGPALRGDSETIKKHVSLLGSLDEDIRDLYIEISSSILNLK